MDSRQTITEQLWPAFVKFCKEENINIEHKDDYSAWYKCFITGALAYKSLEKK